MRRWMSVLRTPLGITATALTVAVLVLAVVAPILWTDEANAVIQAWLFREQAIQMRFSAQPDIVQRMVFGTTQEQYEQQLNQAVEMEDPLGGYRR